MISVVTCQIHSMEAAPIWRYTGGGTGGRLGPLARLGGAKEMESPFLPGVSTRFVADNMADVRNCRIEASGSHTAYQDLSGYFYMVRCL